LCLLLRSSWLTVEDGRHSGAAGVLNRRGGRAAVAATGGAAGRVPLQNSPSRRSTPRQASPSGRKRSPAAAQVGSDRDDRSVAKAVASSVAPPRRKQSSAGAITDACLWAEAGAGPFAEFASWERSEPSITKRFRELRGRPPGVCSPALAPLTPEASTSANRRGAAASGSAAGRVLVLLKLSSAGSEATRRLLLRASGS